jgi:hypothetical protein
MQLQPPPSDTLPGVLVRVGTHPWLALIAGGSLESLPGKVLISGELSIFYALPYLYEQDYLLPQWCYDDFRCEYHGEAAIDFMLRRGDAFPRADVVGRRLSTGERDDRYVKEIDLAAGLFAFACAAGSIGTPLTRIDAAVWPDASVDDRTPLADDDARASRLLRLAVPCVAVPPTSLARLPALMEAALGT